MNEKQKLGRLGEEFAAEILVWKGYEILARNYSCPQGEVDIIAEKDGEIYFVEVKTRQNRAFGEPCDAVNPTKMTHMKRAAMTFLQQQKGYYRGLSFQVMEIGVNHIQHVF